MLLHQLTFWPHGGLEAERLDLATLDPDAVALFEPMFDRGAVFDSTVPCELGEVRVKWTGSESGQALMTCSLGKNIFLSGAVAAGLDAEGDKMILDMFVESLDKVDVIRLAAGDRTKALRSRRERPLLISVPMPTLPQKQFDMLAGIDLLTTAVFLRPLVGRDPG